MARLGQVARGDVAGMGAAPDQVGRAHDHRDTVIVAGPRGFQRRWEFGHANPVPRRYRHLDLGRVVMARQYRAIARGLFDRRRLVPLAVAVAQRLQLIDMRREILVGHGVFALHVSFQLRHIPKLPMPRCVIHQADDSHPVILAKLRHLLDQRLRTDLRPEVQKMADLENIRLSERQKFAGQLSRIPEVSSPSRGNRTHPHRIEYGGDPRSREFRVMRDDRCIMRPAHLGPGFDMTLEIVGMQFDKPGRDIIAPAIEGAGGNTRTIADIGDAAVPDTQ